MKFLTDELRKNGFTYKLNKRNDDVALYEQWDFDDPDNPVLISYEVFKVKITKNFEIKGKQIEGGEKFPGNEDFGSDCFTYSVFKEEFKEHAREKAVEKFHQLKLEKI